MRITIGKRTFDLIDRYAEGHRCTAGEAIALNKLLAHKVKWSREKLVKDLPTHEAHIELCRVANEWSFERDREVEAEAMAIARRMVKDALKAQGKKVTHFSQASISKE